mgnify:CR=1 FL=1
MLFFSTSTWERTTRGQDIFSMLIYGARVSLVVGIVTGLATAFLGAFMGVLTG